MASVCKDILVKLWTAGDDAAAVKTHTNEWNSYACTKHLKNATARLHDLPKHNNKTQCKELLWVSHVACTKNLESKLCDLTVMMLNTNRCKEVIATL